MSIRTISPPGVRLLGGNIVPKPSSAGSWSAFWGPDWDFAGWVQWQIDQAKALGANAIRVIGSPRGIWLGTYDQATYLARYEQVVSYCLSQGLWFYACGGSAGADLPANWANFQATVVAQAQMLKKYGNVVAIDAINEPASIIPTYTTRLDMNNNCLAIYNAIKAVDPNRLISFSQDNGIDVADASSNGLTFANFCDFWDVHYYPDVAGGPAGPTSTDMAQFLSVVPKKPLIFGEYGQPVANGSTLRGQIYQGVERWMSEAAIAGAFAWAITDQSAATSGQFGIMDVNGTLRTEASTPFSASNKATRIAMGL